jgi:hypothetical protein
MVTIKNFVLWDAMPCGSCENRLFGRTYRLHHHEERISELIMMMTLMMEATRTSETSIHELYDVTSQKTGLLTSHRFRTAAKYFPLSEDGSLTHLNCGGYVMLYNLWVFNFCKI